MIAAGLNLSRHPVVLILDGSLLHIPWESMPIFGSISQQTTRLPNFEMLIDRVGKNAVDTDSSFYILNPSGDLTYTKRAFAPYFESKSDWEGVIDRKPDEEEFSGALLNKEMLIYIGHGGGAQYFDLEKMDESIQATSLLMGCSSGVLPHKGLFEP